MCPDLVSLINTFHQAINITTEEAIDKSARLGFVLIENFASITIPITYGKFVVNVSTIASLVSSCIAQFANNYLIIIFMIKLETNVALDIIIACIYDSDFCIWIILIDWLINFHLCIFSLLLYFLLFICFLCSSYSLFACLILH